MSCVEATEVYLRCSARVHLGADQPAAPAVLDDDLLTPFTKFRAR